MRRAPTRDGEAIVEALAAFCRGRGVYTVVDMVQAVGTLVVEVGDVDMIATSGHKPLFVLP